MGILTVTLNPAIDETIYIDRLVPGEVHRARSVEYNAGGKGIDVASCLADWGASVTVAGFLGANNDALFEKLFRAKSICDRFVRVNEATRINVTLVDDEKTTDVYLPGLNITPEKMAVFESAITELLGESKLPTIAVLSGSLPENCPADTYTDMTEKFTLAGMKVLVDTSGTPLKAVLRSQKPPFCVKPNRSELAESLGCPLEKMEDLLAEARKLSERGIGLVVVSLGEEGALFQSGEGALIARLHMDLHNSTVGAGDAMVAGIAAALEEEAGMERIARLSTAFAVGKLGMFGPNLPGREVIEKLASEVVLRSL